MTRGYVSPNEAGLQSESRAVGRRIAKVLDSLATINKWVVEGQIEQDCWNFRQQLIDKLRADGWRVSLNAKDNFQVLPPARTRTRGAA